MIFTYETGLNRTAARGHGQDVRLVALHHGMPMDIALLSRRALTAAALAAVAPAAAQAKPTAPSCARWSHHRMAVEMAEMARMRADHRRIKTPARSIIEDQNPAIRQLTSIRKRLNVKPLPTGHEEHETMMRDADTLGLTMDEMGMSMDMDELDGAKPFDRTSIDMMITHHQGAIRMARAEPAEGGDASLRARSRGRSSRRRSGRSRR